MIFPSSYDSLTDVVSDADWAHHVGGLGRGGVEEVLEGAARHRGGLVQDRLGVVAAQLINLGGNVELDILLNHMNTLSKDSKTLS